MSKLHIQIIEKTKRALTIEETFALIVSQDGGHPARRREHASEYLNSNGVCECVGDGYDERGLPIYSCTVTTTRDATPAEIIAYHYLQLDAVCNIIPRVTGGCDCPFDGDGDCIADGLHFRLAKNALDGKEVVVSVVE